MKIIKKKENKERKPRKKIEIEPKYESDNKNEIQTLKKIDKKKTEIEEKETEDIIDNKKEIEIEPNEILIDNTKNEKIQTDFVKVQAENILIEKQPKTNSSYKIDNKQISIDSNNQKRNLNNNNNNNIPLNQRMNYPYQMYYNNMKTPMTMMQIDPKNPNQPIYYMMIPYNPTDMNNIDKDKNNNFNNMNYLLYQQYMMQNFQNMKNDNQEYPYIYNNFGYNMNHMNMMENKK